MELSRPEKKGSWEIMKVMEVIDELRKVGLEFRGGGFIGKIGVFC